jgi:hypothetical protein
MNTLLNLLFMDFPCALLIINYRAHRGTTQFVISEREGLPLSPLSHLPINLMNFQTICGHIGI